MTRRDVPKLDPARILYGSPLPPLKPSRARPDEEPLWGEGYLPEEFDPACRYVVVEEIGEEDVGIAVALWPRKARDGGLDFGAEESRRTAVVDRASFQRRLRSRLTVDAGARGAARELRERELADGDVFAIMLAVEVPDDGDMRDLGSRWIRGRVVDVTAMARNAAKAAMLSALTGPPLSLDEAADIAAAGEPPPEKEG